MDSVKSILKIIAVVFLIIVLLASAVISVFNGVVEIIEEVAGNILDFLANPLSFINQIVQDARNTFVSATGLR